MNNLLLLFAILFFTNSFGQQYRIVKEIKLEDTLAKNDDATKILYGVSDNVISVVRRINVNSKGYDLKISFSDIETGKLLSCDTIIGLVDQIFRLEDFVFNRKYILITSHSKFIYYDINQLEKSLFFYPKNLEFDKSGIKFKLCGIINDSLVLLYTIYNYNPFDARPGMHMYVLNTNTKRIEDSLFMNFRGIAISYASQNWVTVIKGQIYAVNPLTGEIQVFDSKLKLIGESSLPAFTHKELDENTSFSDKLDSDVARDTKRILSVKESVHPDSLKFFKSLTASLVCTKSFVEETLDTLRQKHTYIENIFTVDDTLLAFDISRPEHRSKYRDLIFFDPIKKKIVKKYNKFQTFPSDTCSRPEQFYTLFLSGSSKTRIPYYHNNFAYKINIYPTSLYKNGSYSDLSERTFKYINKNGYKWSILKYQIE